MAQLQTRDYASLFQRQQEAQVNAAMKQQEMAMRERESAARMAMQRLEMDMKSEEFDLRRELMQSEERRADKRFNLESKRIKTEADLAESELEYKNKLFDSKREEIMNRDRSAQGLNTLETELTTWDTDMLTSDDAVNKLIKRANELNLTATDQEAAKDMLVMLRSQGEAKKVLVAEQELVNSSYAEYKRGLEAATKFNADIDLAELAALRDAGKIGQMRTIIKEKLDLAKEVQTLEERTQADTLKNEQDKEFVGDYMSLAPTDWQPSARAQQEESKGNYGPMARELERAAGLETARQKLDAEADQRIRIEQESKSAGGSGRMSPSQYKKYLREEAKDLEKTIGSDVMNEADRAERQARVQELYGIENALSAGRIVMTEGMTSGDVETIYRGMQNGSVKFVRSKDERDRLKDGDRYYTPGAPGVKVYRKAKPESKPAPSS